MYRKAHFMAIINVKRNVNVLQRFSIMARLRYSLSLIIRVPMSRICMSFTEESDDLC